MTESQRPWFTAIHEPSTTADADSSSGDKDDALTEPLEQHVDAQDDPQQPEGESDWTALPSDTLGLAISGGGIRSAVYSLGIIQALARNDWLRHVDYLSTVSGGGYTGSFLGRFFDQCVKTDGLAGAYGDVEPGAAQTRVQQELTDSSSPVIQWLRSHANYLSPTGFGESLFNFATFWRNFLSLYFVLGFFFFALFGAVNALTYSAWLSEWLGAKSAVASGITPLQHLLPVWSQTPWTALVELLLWLTIVPLAFAYWLASQDHYRRFVMPLLIALLLVSAGALVVTRQPVVLAIFVAAIIWTYESWWAIDKHEGHGNFDHPWRIALARNHLTYRLVFWVSTGVLTAAFALIDGLGMRLARENLLGQLTLTTLATYVTTIVGFVTLVSPVFQFLASLLTADEGRSNGIVATIARIPYLPTLIVLLLGAFLPLLGVSFLAHAAFQVGYAYTAGLLATLLGVLVTLLLGGKTAMPFVNRSGPLTIYTARLARVFLGAVNPNRLRRDDGLDVSHVIEGDDVPFAEYAPYAAGGPLHLINVAVNQTVDLASRRGLRERQAENMAVGPAGINLSTRWHGTWVAAGTQPGRIQAISDGTELPHPFVSTQGDPVALEPLGLRKWMAISGAAISPALGRMTGTAVSLVATLANARLGYWWDSGLRPTDRARIAHRLGGFDRIRLFLQNFMQAQTLLLQELRGRFPGPWNRHWYLSDGGHFENSAAYELIRRRVPYIILCGAGQDRRQEATDIAELTRMVRIDFGAEVRDATQLYGDLAELGVPEAIKQRIGSLDDVLAAQEGSPSKQHAALFRVTFAARDDADSWHGRSVCWMLYLKASLSGDESSDVANYAKTHPDFPNETTLDQFFDERQWESYRKLGDHIGTHIFNNLNSARVEA